MGFLIVWGLKYTRATGIRQVGSCHLIILLCVIPVSIRSQAVSLLRVAQGLLITLIAISHLRDGTAVLHCVWLQTVL